MGRQGTLLVPDKGRDTSGHIRVVGPLSSTLRDWPGWHRASRRERLRVYVTEARFSLLDLTLILVGWAIVRAVLS